MAKEYLVKSECYINYSRGLISVEVIDEKTLEELRQLIQDKFSFYEYEIAGKHSEVKITLDENDFVVISEDIDDIATFKRLFGESVGNIKYSERVLDNAYEQGYFDDENDV
ncbi:hypothetical protein [Brevibacillus laterosporus]|uniref:hypothetical protein n=1 Tax=Brevibacillus laterosporus TaxID=1465 RepID=UPI00215CA3AD|nr:hypothetical protein [Brevibacillus laterosporus]MCR8994700.1 hypothetical protein [Brevibacillus laterosporus]